MHHAIPRTRDAARPVLPALAALGVLVASLGSARESSVFPLVVVGQPAACVVVGPSHPVLDAAVDDLRHYVLRITGAELEIVRDPASERSPSIHIGETRHFAATAGARRGVRGDGFALIAVGDDLVVAGNMPEGTANGVWTLIQDAFGVRWYFPGALWEIVPRAESLAVSFEPNAEAGARVENPSFPGRALWSGGTEAPWERRMRMTQPSVSLPYVGTGHHLGLVVPAGRYFESHPQYYALVDGRRTTEHLCLAHPDMFDLFMAYVRANAAAGRTVSSFGVNDTYTVCRCDACRAADGATEYMGMAGFSESYFQLLRRVALRTAGEFPGMRISAFAYQQTGKPPETVDRIGDNVHIVLCQDTAQHFDRDVQRTDFVYSAGFARKAGAVSFYDYYGMDTWTPRYCPALMDEQIKHLAGVGVLGGQTHAVTMPGSAMPMWYLYRRLLWDADLDARVLIERMILDLYGEAADPVLRYYDHWDRCWMRQPEGRWFRTMDDLRAEFAIYSMDDILRGVSLLDEAEAAARDGAVLERIAFLRDDLAFTRAAAEAHFAYESAVRAAPQTPDSAQARSEEAVRAWTAFNAALDAAEKGPKSSASGWHPNTFRVRYRTLRDEIRDAVMAPLVAWAVAGESRLGREEIAAMEKEFADAARARLRRVSTDRAGSAPFEPRVEPLEVADLPVVGRFRGAWETIPFIDAAAWRFRRARPGDDVGRYEEPPENLVEPPDPADLSVRWKTVADPTALYILAIVADDAHTQERDAALMWQNDSLQVALTPHRAAAFARFDQGYGADDTEFGIALGSGLPVLHFWKAPDDVENPAQLVSARVSRDTGETRYEIAIGWQLLPGYEPKEGRSFGFALVVNDADGDRYQQAEYGGGVADGKRPKRMSALRLADDLH